ncbi:hypothetical protein QFZ22_000480 [Streptomyces canus]|uniref:DNA polymerase Y-family little finger domain-containing protein n=1 Tax=Streptomyces canus TaxID=58343 RepID=A0AAW8F5H4_9ACTN|nr:hypothetical protein [Streptomyces canus]MDQ0904495.1 hypothetical protein [Streptomyces canus]
MAWAVISAASFALVVRLGTRLRGRGQVARALTLTLKFADGSSWEKTRRLAAPSAHEDDLRQLAYQLMDAAGLQRGRLTGLVLKGEDLVDADQAAWQLSSMTPAKPASPPKPPSTASATSSARRSSAPPSSAAPHNPHPDPLPLEVDPCCSTRQDRAAHPRRCRTGPT